MADVTYCIRISDGKRRRSYHAMEREGAYVLEIKASDEALPIQLVSDLNSGKIQIVKKVLETALDYFRAEKNYRGYFSIDSIPEEDEKLLRALFTNETELGK